MTAPRRRLVILGADAHVLRVASELDCEIVHVRPPSYSVKPSVRPGDLYYAVDYRRADFMSFVSVVLRPLTPLAVVSIAADAVLPAAQATDLLGSLGTPETVARRFEAGKRGAPADLAVVTFSLGGKHRILAVTEPGRPKGHRRADLAQAGDIDGLAADVRAFLDDNGLVHGAASTQVRRHGARSRVVRSSLAPADEEVLALITRALAIDLVRWGIEWPIAYSDAGSPPSPSWSSFGEAAVALAVPQSATGTPAR